MELDGATMAITGVGGFIGLRMVARARERGIAVRGLEVSPAAARRAEEADAHVTVGDVNDEAAVRRALGGAAVVFHTAAIVGEGGDLAAYRKINVEGTRTVARLAGEAGVQRFVHLSSVMVYGFRYPADVSEEGPLRGDGNAYCQSKIESEEAALAHHRPGATEVIVIRPGDVYGPGSMPWVVRPLRFMRRGLFLLPDGGRGIMNHVHIDNLLDAVFLALDKDATGTAFNVTDGEATTFRDYFGRLAALIGRKGVHTAPSSLLKALFGAAELGARLVRREPMARASVVDFLRRPHAYSIAKARRVLGYEPRVTLAEGMAEVGRWLAAAGALG